MGVVSLREMPRQQNAQQTFTFFLVVSHACIALSLSAYTQNMSKNVLMAETTESDAFWPLHFLAFPRLVAASASQRANTSEGILYLCVRR